MNNWYHAKKITPVLKPLLTAASIHFSDWGGGGGLAKVENAPSPPKKKKKKKIGALRAQSRNIKLCAKMTIVYKFNGFVVHDSAFKPILALHIINFSSCRNYWGGGGKTICLPPPQYFHGGGGGSDCPQPPPPPGSTPLTTYDIFNAHDCYRNNHR